MPTNRLLIAKIFLTLAVLLTPLSGVVLNAESAPPARYENEKETESNHTRIASPVESKELFQSMTAESLSINLIENGSVENGLTNAPTAWFKGGYGSNTRTYAYPVTGQSGDGLRVNVSGYTSGDAKWYFKDVPVSAGQEYQFSNYSSSTAPSIITIRYTLSSGGYLYKDIALVSSSSSYKQNTVKFVVPSGATSLTVFHLLKTNGTLDTDEYSLQRVSSDSTTGNLILNGDFEAAQSSTMPANWLKGGFGSNTRILSYPASGVSNSKAAKVEITQFSTGDAKWYFTPVTVQPGTTYEYSNNYQSNVPSALTIQYQRTDGSYFYAYLGALPAASTFSQAKASFTVPSGVQKLTVFHLIRSIGYLTIDNATLVEKDSTQSIFDTGAVTLTFDDGWYSQYSVAYPKLQSAGINATFYIASRQNANYGYGGFMSFENMRTLYKSGNEIGSHSRTHAHLTDLDEADQRAEIIGARNDLLAQNLGPILSFAYPFGEYDETTLSILGSSDYTSARSTIDGHATPSSDNLQLERMPVDADTSLASIKYEIDKALQNKTWLILNFHQLSSTTGDYYRTSPQTFNAIVDYIKQKNARVVTISEGVESLD